MLSNISNVARYRVHANATAVSDPYLCVFYFYIICKLSSTVACYDYGCRGGFGGGCVDKQTKDD